MRDLYDRTILANGCPPTELRPMTTTAEHITAFEQRRLTRPDGVGLAYRVYQPNQAAASQAPVLCLNGLTRNARDFDELAPMIAGLGRTVIVAEQRGRGLSDRDPNPQNYAIPVYVDDMIALLDAENASAAVCVGTSMGGLITMNMARAEPGRVAAAVINDTGPDLSRPGLERIAAYAPHTPTVADWQAAAAYAHEINGVAFPDETDPAFWRQFAERLFIQDPSGELRLDYDPEIARQLASADITPVDLWPAFEALRDVPTLLVRGELSDLVSAETAVRMQTAKTDLEVVEAKRIGHAPFMTEADVWPVVAAFINRAP